MKLLKIKTLDEAMEYMDLLAEMLRIGTLQVLMRHRVKRNLIYLVEVCITLGKIMAFKPNLHL
jgi:hypothetical protein